MTRRQWAMLVAGGVVLAALCVAIVIAPPQGPPRPRPPSSHAAFSLTGALTLVTVLATVAQATVAVIMVRGLKHSQRAADAAAATLAETKAANLTSLRAYVAFSDTSLGAFNPGERLNARVTAKNFGRTPALNAQLFVRLEMCAVGVDPLYDQGTHPPPGQVSSLGMMAPDATVTATPRGAALLSDQQVKDVLEGRSDIHLWGWVRYESFGAIRVSHFRLSNKLRDLGQVGVLHWRETGNEST